MQTEAPTLAENFAGQLLEPGDPGYDEARAIYNGMIDRRPALIARCTGTADVIATVRHAREKDLPIAVRCGGHGVAGNSLCDDGVVVDLSLMRGVRVDPERKVARANGGAVTVELDREAHLFGFATATGRVTTTGVGGFTLGGGYAWISPLCGLACDNLLSADVVTADGNFVVAGPDDNEDLLWGLRGGGGNFGIVTSYEFRLHEIPPAILGGLLVYPLERAREVMQTYRDTVKDAPRELATGTALVNAPPEEFIPESFHGQPVLGIIVAWCGDPAAGEKVVAPLRESGPVADVVGPMPYVALQTLFDPLSPPGFRNYWRGEHLTDLTDDVIDTYLEFPPEGLYPLTAAVIFQHGGAVGDVGEEETAFSHRDARFMVHPIGCWEDPADDEKHLAWVRGLSEAMQPHKTGGVYLNFMADQQEDRVRAGYGDAKYERLAALKAKYDPDNVFRFNQNVKPKSSG